jgi:hypothetical protein
MPTTTTSSIGTGGDYTTIAAWEAACPANLVTADQIWRGECKNQTFSNGGGTVVAFGGVTTDATRYIELTTEAGASFVDDPDFATNPLRYDATKGAALTCDSNYATGSAIFVDASGIKVRITKLQIRSTSGGSGIPIYMNSPGNVEIDRCILESSAPAAAGSVAYLQGSDSFAANSALICRNSGAGTSIVGLVFGSSLYNCTLAAVNGTVTDALSGSYGTPVVRNCLIFGGTNVKTGSTPTYTTCLTNAASPPTGCTTTAFSTSTGIQFENITNGSHDLRIKVGSSAINAGTTDATYGATSINGVSRVSGQYDVGAWEVDSGGSTPIEFDGTIPTLTGTVGAAFSEDISSYFDGTETPFSYAVQAGTLPAGLSLNSSTGVISGTPTTAGTATGIVIRGTDATPDTADSNSFSIAISPAAATSMTVALKQSDGTTAAASITGIEYAILNASTLGAATAILDTGTGESTDGSGNLVLDITGLGLVDGNVRYVLAGKSNGTVGADFDGWQGPATAAA